MKLEICFGGLAGLAVAFALPLSGACAGYPGASSPAVMKDPPATLKSVPGSTVKRVMLTAKAAERLGIEMGKVGEEPIVRKQMVGGVVVPPASRPQPKMAGGAFGGFAMPARAPAPLPAEVQTKGPATGEAWVSVALSRAEWESLAKDQPARILPLTTRSGPREEILARPSGMPPFEDTKRSMLRLFFVVPGDKHGLLMHQRMRVELQQSGSDQKRKVVPYGAVYYDATGTAWIYLNPEPLGFERQRIRIERVVGDLAILAEGPPVGTPVVTVGAALLYGVEVFGK